jgi:hypothetical protein
MALAPLWNPSSAALATPKIQVTRANKLAAKPMGLLNKSSLASSPSSSQSLSSPRTALKIVASLMLLFGITGVLTPNFHYHDLAGFAPLQPLSDPGRFYMIMTGVRETMMAVWILRASFHSSNATIQFMAYTIALAMVPVQLATLIAKKTAFRPDAYKQALIFQFLVGCYLGLTAYFGA